MPTISLALGERSYDIHVENGALDRVGEFAYRAGLDGKIAIITDTCVAPLYAERVMKSLEIRMAVSPGFAAARNGRFLSIRYFSLALFERWFPN